jgi:hypothetical protein
MYIYLFIISLSILYLDNYIHGFYYLNILLTVNKLMLVSNLSYFHCSGSIICITAFSVIDSYLFNKVGIITE